MQVLYTYKKSVCFFFYRYELVIITKYAKINTCNLLSVMCDSAILTKATCKNIKEERNWELSNDTKGNTWKSNISHFKMLALVTTVSYELYPIVTILLQSLDPSFSLY